MKLATDLGTHKIGLLWKIQQIHRTFKLHKRRKNQLCLAL